MHLRARMRVSVLITNISHLNLFFKKSSVMFFSHYPTDFIAIFSPCCRNPREHMYGCVYKGRCCVNGPTCDCPSCQQATGATQQQLVKVLMGNAVQIEDPGKTSADSWSSLKLFPLTTSSNLGMKLP